MLSRTVSNFLQHRYVWVFFSEWQTSPVQLYMSKKDEINRSPKNENKTKKRFSMEARGIWKIVELPRFYTLYSVADKRKMLRIDYQLKIFFVLDLKSLVRLKFFLKRL